MKIKNKHLLDSGMISRADNIWLMTREDLYEFTERLWNKVDEDLLDPQDTIESWYGEELHNEVQKRFEQLAKEDEKKRYATVTVDDEEYKTITYFDMYHLGWECDTKGFVVETRNGPRFVLTNHGTAYFAEAATIEAKIKELNGAVKAMKSALTAVSLG